MHSTVTYSLPASIHHFKLSQPNRAVNIHLSKQRCASSIPPVAILRRTFSMRTSLRVRRPSWGCDLRHLPKMLTQPLYQQILRYFIYSRHFLSTPACSNPEAAYI